MFLNIGFGGRSFILGHIGPSWEHLGRTWGLRGSTLGLSYNVDAILGLSRGTWGLRGSTLGFLILAKWQLLIVRMFFFLVFEHSRWGQKSHLGHVGAIEGGLRGNLGPHWWRLVLCWSYLWGT